MRAHVLFVIASVTAACNGAAVHDAPTVETPAAADSAAPGRAQASPSPTRQDREREHDQRLRNAIADRWASEPVDVAWQFAREREVTEALAGPSFPATTIRTIACRSTICRLVVEQARIEDRELFFQATAASSAFPEDLFGYYPEATLRSDSEVWISRRGHDLMPPTQGG